MNDVDKRVRESLDAVTMPDEFKQQTLTYIYKVSEQDASADTGSKKQGATHESPIRRRPFIMRSLVRAIAACLVLTVLGVTGWNLYYTETAFVDIELNPSLEIGLNRFDRVISERPLNKDAEEVLQSVTLQGKSYDKAMTDLTEDPVFLGYITEDASIEVSISGENEQQTQTLLAQSNHHVSNLPCSGSAHHVSDELYDEARNAGMGVARYAAAKQLMELDSQMTLEQCQSLSMRELRERIYALDPDASLAFSGKGEEGGRHGSGHSQSGTKRRGH